MLVVDIQHWLDDNGDLPLGPPRLRRNAIRIAQLIEYGGPLEVGQTRETLVPCTKRPGRKPCPGMLWAVKERDERIYAGCIACRKGEVVWATIKGLEPPTTCRISRAVEHTGVVRDDEPEVGAPRFLAES